MAFKRAEIREILGEAYTDDIATKLVELHRGVVDPLKDDLDAAKRDATRYKAEAEKVPGLEKDLDEAKKGEDWKKKFEKAEQDLNAPENIDSNISDFFPLFSNGWNFLGFRLKSACLDGSQGIVPAFTDPKKGPRKCTRPSPSRHPQRVAFFVPRPSRARTWTVPTYSLSLDEIIYIIFCR